MLCQCWGQPYEPKSNRSYRADLQEWQVPPGQRHSQTLIAFALKRGGVHAQRGVQPCHRAVANDQASPPDAWSWLTRADLEKLAAQTARLLSTARDETVLREYWGQPYGPPHKRRYRREPEEWIVPPGQPHSRTPIAFAFKRGGVDAQWELNVQPCHHAVAHDQATP